MQDKATSNIGLKLLTEGNNQEGTPFRLAGNGVTSVAGESLAAYQRLVTTKHERRDNYVKQFCTALKTASEQNNAPEEFLGFIGDKTLFKHSAWINIKLMHRNFQLQLELKFFEKIKQYISILVNMLIIQLKRIELFQPESPIKLIWDLASLVSRLYFLFLIPLDITWSKYSFMFGMYNLTSFIFQMVLLGDLIVGLNTAFYKQGQLVTDRSQIVYHNFAKCYGLEWTSTIQLLVYQILTQDEYVAQSIKDYKIYLTLVTFLVHYSTIQECLEYYEEGLNLSRKASSILQLIKLIAVLFFVLHMFSCFWFWVGDYSHTNYGKSWLESVYDEPWDVQYLQSIYYSTVTMFTIGYGDVLPQSNLEKIVISLFIMCASLQLPYSINTVGAIIQQISEYGEDKKRKLRIINSYMQKKKIPFQLQSEIRQYLNYYWQINKEQNADEAEIMIKQLSENLKERFVQESNSVILNQCALFRYRFTPAFKRELIKSLKTKIIAPETVIGDKNELIYIESGVIDTYGDNQCNLKLKSSIQGQTIGLIPFITGEHARETYRSQGFCLVMSLSHRKFKRTLKEFPNDYEIYCQIKDYLLFNGNATTIFPRMCHACKALSHYSYECPSVHYVPDREKLIKKFTISTPQKRKPLPRSEMKKARFPSRKLTGQALAKAAFIVQQEHSAAIKIYDNVGALQVEEETKINNLHVYNDVKHKKMKKSNEHQQQLKSKFQHLVKKLMTIDKSYPKFLMVALQNFRENQNYFSIVVQMQQLKLRYEHLKSIPDIDQNMLESVDILIKKHEITDVFERNDFESPRNFIHYNPKFNYSNVKLRIDRAKLKIITALQRYFLHPALVMRQFHTSKTTSDLTTYNRRNNLF